MTHLLQVKPQAVLLVVRARLQAMLLVIIASARLFTVSCN